MLSITIRNQLNLRTRSFTTTAGRKMPPKLIVGSARQLALQQERAAARVAARAVTMSKFGDVQTCVHFMNNEGDIISNCSYFPDMVKELAAVTCTPIGKGGTWWETFKGITANYNTVKSTGDMASDVGNLASALYDLGSNPVIREPIMRGAAYIAGTAVAGSILASQPELAPAVSTAVSTAVDPESLFQTDMMWQVVRNLFGEANEANDLRDAVIKDLLTDTNRK